MREFLMFLGAVAIAFIIIFVVVILLAVYSCCFVASRCSRFEDKEYESLQNESVILSDLEKQTVNELKKELLEDFDK